MISVYYGSDPGYSFHKAQKDLKKKLSEEEYGSIEKFDGYKNLLSEAVESQALRLRILDEEDPAAACQEVVEIITSTMVARMQMEARPAPLRFIR